MNTTEQETLFNYAELRCAVLKLRAANHKLRQRILDLIFNRGAMNVTDIYIKLRLEQSVASQHLGILRRAKALKTVRKGKSIYYDINHDELGNVQDAIELLNK